MTATTDEKETCEHVSAEPYFDHRGCFHRYCAKCGAMLLMWEEENDNDDE